MTWIIRLSSGSFEHDLVQCGTIPREPTELMASYFRTVITCDVLIAARKTFADQLHSDCWPIFLLSKGPCVGLVRCFAVLSECNM